eukprot:350655-Chlamydomonas_euryale.AAC.9
MKADDRSRTEAVDCGGGWWLRPGTVPSPVDAKLVIDQHRYCTDNVLLATGQHCRQCTAGNRTALPSPLPQGVGGRRVDSAPVIW